MKREIDVLWQAMAASRDKELKEANGFFLLPQCETVKSYYEGYEQALKDVEKADRANENELITLIEYHDYRLFQKRVSQCKPFIVAAHYDPKIATWACGYYFDEVHDALKKFDEVALGHQKEEKEKEAVDFVLHLYRAIFDKPLMNVGMVADVIYEQLDLWGYDEDEIKGEGESQNG